MRWRAGSPRVPRVDTAGSIRRSYPPAAGFVRLLSRATIPVIRLILPHAPPRGAGRILLLLALIASAGAASPALAQTTHVRGTVLYEKIPVTRAGLQLD